MIMNNNDIFKKLRVALQLRDDQIVDILALVDFRISKAEIGGFFRNADHPKFVECGDQVLRNFLNGLVIHLRGDKENPKNPMEVIKSHKILQPTSGDFVKKDFPKDKHISKPKSLVKPEVKKDGPKHKIQTKKVQVVEKVKFKNGKKGK
jgi:hypothetical protein